MLRTERLSNIDRIIEELKQGIENEINSNTTTPERQATDGPTTEEQLTPEQVQKLRHAEYERFRADLAKRRQDRRDRTYHSTDLSDFQEVGIAVLSGGTNSLDPVIDEVARYNNVQGCRDGNYIVDADELGLRRQRAIERAEQWIVERASVIEQLAGPGVMYNYLQELYIADDCDREFKVEAPPLGDDWPRCDRTRRPLIKLVERQQ